MLPYILHLEKVNRAHIHKVGGKGANLGELLQAGFPVPQGYCITTSAYEKLVNQTASMTSFYEQLGQLNASDIEEVRRISKEIRTCIMGLSVPSDVHEAILHAWRVLGTDYRYAVRSSATAEDLPTASFAGQQDTFLNIKGEQQLLDAIRRCWASLFSERAIVYRIKNGYDHQAVQLAVVIQQMIEPDVSGVMFTADPVTGNRTITSIDASFGLGEALVSGIVNPDLYQVRKGEIVKKQVANKQKAVRPLTEGGTVVEAISAKKQNLQALSDEEIMALTQMGERIQAHYGTEQDIEWCLVNRQFYIVQARPITSLFPVPEAPDDELHVYISSGHMQMMTDVMTPAGISMWKHLTPADQGANIDSQIEVGGRLFADVTHVLQSNMARKVFLFIIDKFEPLISSAARQVLPRFPIKEGPMPGMEQFNQMIPFLATKVMKDLLEGDGETAYEEVKSYASQCSVLCRQALDGCSGVERIAYVQKNCGSLMQGLMAIDMHYMAAASVAKEMLTLLSKWWTFDEGDLLTLNKSLPYNVTGEMGLQLGDLADLARDHPELVIYLRDAVEDGFMEGLNSIAGGSEFKAAFEQWLDQYGARCPGEIDVARTRWSERPYMLVSSIVGHLNSVKHGEHRERFRQGELEAEAAAERIQAQVRTADDGAFKEKVVSRLMTVYRSFMGLREHHKFVLVRHFALYKQALLEEADALVAKGVLCERDDIFFLNLPEMLEVIEESFEKDVQQLILRRKEDFEYYKRLTPPRVMTSEGEIIEGSVQGEDAPEGALIGTPVSPGIIEGRAKVVLDPTTASLKEGEILVAPYTDPGWTPLFQQAKGLITEMGGLMTHGAVVAREYGLPAVVGIEHATTIIKDGDRLRLDGSKGYVEVLKEASFVD
ncbi:phosphoenolpyruvate synthase [Paenibacillus sp. SC116]|uniref:phosphoenolpyruvate synthase n=1 Tax=Paenibacillus sp. SC116 TaxID=2968986 RepID=UPI00215ABF7B|nr:phosphoenolpyruvate synthase [Paenibacillus sp. SC116]MCR8842299.1 phosphoenolpyruvate synthase [Paenibacillus sp. SC116]